MKFLYDDESFSFEALRATGFADYGGAELGEVLVTCRQIPKGQPQQVYNALTCQKELITFREDDGGGEHCHEGAVSVFHQRTFDWLDTALAS